MRISKRLNENFITCDKNILSANGRSVKIGTEESEFLSKILDDVNAMPDTPTYDMGLTQDIAHILFNVDIPNRDVAKKALYALSYVLFGAKGFYICIYVCDTVEKDWTLDVRARLSSYLFEDSCGGLYDSTDEEYGIDVNLTPKDFNLPYDLHFSYYDKYDEKEREDIYEENLYDYVHTLYHDITKDEYKKILLPKFLDKPFFKDTKDMAKDIITNCTYVNNDYIEIL